ncbi:MAG TPA: type II toxin-antitoxin system ParD family antitoxin [Thermomicrobiales bacterium]
MSVMLTPQLETLIERMLATGHYADAGDVLEQAVRLLAERERRRRLHDALAVGVAQIERGEVVELTPAVWAEIDREADEADRLELPIDPDVCR